MNILEAEDMVKGLPDQVLFQYAQNPPPQIPQFLAISEVQRRQEMRQRFQAQGGNAEPTIKDQILQGGIASAGGPPPGGEPPPMAPPGAAPPGAPMQQPMTGAPMPPMGMSDGGRVPGGNPQVFREFMRRNFATPQGIAANVGLVGGALLGGPIGAGIGGNLGTYVGQQLTPPAKPLTPFEMMRGGLRAPEGGAVGGGGGGGLPYGGPTSYASERSQLNNLINQFGDRTRPTVTVEEIPQGMAAGGYVPGTIFMQAGREVDIYKLSNLSPIDLARIARQYQRLGINSDFVLNPQTFDSLPISKRKELFKRLSVNEMESSQAYAPDSVNTQQNTGATVPSERRIQEILRKGPAARTTEENETLRAAGLTLSRRELPQDSGIARLDQFLSSPFIRERIGSPNLSEEELKSAKGTAAINEQIARMLGASQVTPAAPAAAPAPVNLPANFDFMAANRAMTGPRNAPLAVALSAAAPAATNAPPVSPGGIVNAGAAMAGQRTAAPAAGSQSALSLQSLLSGLASNERPAEVQAAIDLQRQQMEQGLPPPVDISQFIQSAQQRQKEAKDEARRMAIAGTLTSLGAGVMGGDPAAGLRQATQTAMSTLAEGRREASAEGRMAEQLQLQAAQQQRQAILDTMKFKSDAVNNIANIVSGEQKATRSDKLQAAQIISTYQANRERIIADERVQLGRNANSAQAARSAALKVAGEYIKDNPTLTIKEDGQRFTPEEVSKLTRDFAMSLDPEAFGGSSASATLSKADQEALAWANSNPNDPRASQIKAKLGVP